VIRFTVSGRPAPKGSRTRGMTADGRHYTRPASKYEKPWTDAVQRAAEGHPALLPPYRVDLHFRFTRPAKPRYAWPVAADLDKAARATLDGLVKARLIADDKHVVQINASAEYGEQGCDVTVAHLRPHPG
jgi:Holliday junction resolvase RusA-like endonuclease